MPTYEYACKKCGEHFDVVQSFADDPLKRHKGGCGGSVRRVFGSVGISFKGSGFYKNDSRSSSSSSSSSSSTSNGDSTSSESTSSESKSSESKSSESKASESKASESKSESKSQSAPSKK